MMLTHRPVRLRRRAFRRAILGACLVLPAAVWLPARAQEAPPPAAGQEGTVPLVDFRNAKIDNVLRLLSQQGEQGFMLAPGLTVPPVTMRATNVDVNDLIASIIGTSGLESRERGGILEIFRPAEETADQKAVREQGRIRYYRLNFADARKVGEVLKGVLGGTGGSPVEVLRAGNAGSNTSMQNDVELDVPSNTIVVRARTEVLDDIALLIKELDKQPPVVRIETRIVERTLNDEERIGADWVMRLAASMGKAPTTFPFNKGAGEQSAFNPRVLQTTSTGGTTTTGVSQDSWPTASEAQYSFGALDASQFSIVLEAIYQNGDAHLVASPEVTSVDGAVSKVNLSQRVPVPVFSDIGGTGTGAAFRTITDFDEVEVGTILTVVPRVNKDGLITLSLAPEVSSIVRFIGPNEEKPLIATRKVQTTVMVQDGYTVVIGGLVQTRTTTVESQVPLLGAIPLLGRLFRHTSDTTERTELIFFITPRVISTDLNESDRGETPREE